MKIGDPGTEPQPLALAATVVLFASEDSEVPRVVHGELGSQDHAEFVVEFKGVFPHPMFDPDPLGTIFEITDNLAREVIANSASQKAHDVAAGKRGHRMQNQGGIDGSEGDRGFKGEVGGPFAFINRPIILDRKAFEYPCM